MSTTKGPSFTLALFDPSKTFKKAQTATVESTRDSKVPKAPKPYQRGFVKGTPYDRVEEGIMRRQRAYQERRRQGQWTRVEVSE